MGKPTIRDVAALSGVSTASVSYALRPSDRRRHMRPDTYNRIMEAAERLGYVPHSAAATLARGHSDVVLIALDSTFVGEVSERSNRHIIEAFAGYGYQPLLYSITSEQDLLAVASAIRPVGVMHLAFLSENTRDLLRGSGARFVFGLTTEDPAATPRRPWEAELGATQVAHALERGYDRVIYVHPHRSARLPVVVDRLAGVRRRSLEAGVPEPRVVAVNLDIGHITERLASITRSLDRGVVIGFDDRTALGVLSALHLLGRKVPEELGIIGADNTPESALTLPALTTVQLDNTMETDLLSTWIEAALAGQDTTLLASDDTVAVTTFHRETT